MTNFEILKIVSGVIASVGTASAIIWYFVKLTANTLADQYKEKIKHDFGRQLENYKAQLDILKATALKYNDRQFDLYLDLWKNLQELKFTTLDLWDTITQTNYKNFKKALQKADRQIETFSILIEENHYIELRDIIRVMREYDSGKIRLRDRNISASNDEIRQMIQENQERINNFLGIIDRVKKDIQSNISGIRVNE
jgi:hypothetical protein